MSAPKSNAVRGPSPAGVLAVVAGGQDQVPVRSSEFARYQLTHAGLRIVLGRPNHHEPTTLRRSVRWRRRKPCFLSAERDLKSSKQNSNSNTASYLATLSLLGQCHMLLGDDTSAATVFQTGIRAAAASGSSAMSATSATSPGAPQSARWQAHFLLFLARVEGNPRCSHAKVDGHLKAVEALNIDDPVYRTVLALSQAVSAMQRGGHKPRRSASHEDRHGARRGLATIYYILRHLQLGVSVDTKALHGEPPGALLLAIRPQRPHGRARRASCLRRDVPGL